MGISCRGCLQLDNSAAQMPDACCVLRVQASTRLSLPLCNHRGECVLSQRLVRTQEEAFSHVPHAAIHIGSGGASCMLWCICPCNAFVAGWVICHCRVPTLVTTLQRAGFK